MKRKIFVSFLMCVLLCNVIFLTACADRVDKSVLICEAEAEETNVENAESTVVVSENDDGFYEEEPEIVEEVVEVEPKKIVISIAGDAMLASYKNQNATNGFNEYAEREEPHYFFDGVSSVFQNDDFTIVNLENVFTDQNLTERIKPENPAYWYRSKTANVNILTESSIECVSLSNNHTNDYGEAGYTDTKNTLKEANVLYGTNEETFYIEKDGYKIAVICNGLWYAGQENSIINRIKEAEQYSDFQIVYYHGGTERVHKPEDWRIASSRKLVDNGADCVIGNHPHVIQPMEVYNGADIVYSLGNFCFGGSKHPENRTIIYQITLNFDENYNYSGYTSQIIPCYVYTGSENNYQPAIIEDDVEKQRVLDFMNWGVDSPL